MPNPIIRQLSAFDANEGSYLEFAVPNNTEQIYGSGIIIRDNDTNEIIYKEGINDEGG